MRTTQLALLLASAIVAFSPAVFAQKFQPKTIQFQGAPDYSNDELIAAAGLKKGETLSADEMQAHANQLSNSGLFAGIKYTFDGQDLVFHLTPSPQLYAVRLDNLPLKPGAELDAKIRAKQPLYHGKVPLDGTLLDGVKAVLEEQLAAIGIKAEVAAAPFNAVGEKAVSALAFNIASPPVVIGEIQQDGSVPLAPKAQAMLASITGSPYSVADSPEAIAKNLTGIYHDMGYLDAKVEAAQLDTLAIAPDAVRVPFRFSLTPGALYKVTSIQLAPDMLVSQADFDKQSQVHPGDPADAPHISENWHFLDRQYHNHGYMKARIEHKATLDPAQHTVSYAVTAEPGPTYTMGKLAIENVSDDIRNMMLAAWKTPAGAVFNEGAILSYFAIDATDKAADPRLFRLFHAVSCKYTLHINDEEKTVDVVLRLEKHAS